MKTRLPFVAAGLLALLSLGAQAQVTLDGTLGAGEAGPATAGKYVSLGQYPYAHGFEEGLLAFYGANSASKLYLLVAGTIQPYPKGNNSFQVFMVGSKPTIPNGEVLPSPVTTGSTGSTTSFGKFNGLLDQAVYYGLAMRTNGTPGQYQIEAAAYYVISYNNGQYAAADTVLSAAAAPMLDNGTVLTLPTIQTGRFKGFSGARLAYRNTADGLLTSNAGYVTPVTTASATPGTNYGTAAGTTGWEIELDRTALSVMQAKSNGSDFNFFVQQNNNDGSYVSSDYIPNAVFNSGTNLGNNPSYDAIQGYQYAYFKFVTVTLATHAAAEALALGVFPNPAADVATVAYQVAAPNTAVSITLLDLTGRLVRTVESGVKNAGEQTATLRTGSLAAGTYLLRVQVGDNVATSKVAVR